MTAHPIQPVDEWNLVRVRQGVGLQAFTSRSTLRTSARPLEVLVSGQLRFEGITLTVESVAASVAYYGGLLGLEVAHNAAPAFAMIKISGDLGGTIGLLSIAEGAKEGVEPASPLQKRGIHVEFTTDDLDALYDELVARGVAFDQPPHDEPWERVMTALDPDGYAVEIAQGRRGHDGAMWNNQTAD